MAWEMSFGGVCSRPGTCLREGDRECVAYRCGDSDIALKGVQRGGQCVEAALKVRLSGAGEAAEGEAWFGEAGGERRGGSGRVSGGRRLAVQVLQRLWRRA